MRAETVDHASPGGSDAPSTGPGRTAGTGHRAGTGSLRYLQVIPVAVILWGLDAVDKFRGGAEAAGLRNAAAVAAVSRQAGGGFMVPMNNWLATHQVAAIVATGYYIVLHGLVVGVVGILLIWRRVPSFRLHRNALIATSAIGLVVFLLYPVAPPRMLAGYHDVAASAVPLFSDVLEGKAADMFASLPSLHVTWALWVAVAASSLLRRPALRAAVWVYPALTVLDVFATANHYLLDVIVAPGVLLLAYAVAAAPALGARSGPWGRRGLAAAMMHRPQAWPHRPQAWPRRVACLVAFPLAKRRATDVQLLAAAP